MQVLVPKPVSFFGRILNWTKRKFHYFGIVALVAAMFAVYYHKQDRSSGPKKKPDEESQNEVPAQSLTKPKEPESESVVAKKRSDDLGDKYVMNRNISVSYWYELKRRFLDTRNIFLQVEDLSLLKNAAIDLISKPVRLHLDTFLLETHSLLKSDSYSVAGFETLVNKFSEDTYQLFCDYLQELIQDFGILQNDFDQAVKQNPQITIMSHSFELHMDILNTCLAKSGPSIPLNSIQDEDLARYICKAVECLEIQQSTQPPQQKLTKCYLAFTSAAVELSEPCELPLLLGLLAPSPDAPEAVQTAYERFSQLLDGLSDPTSRP